MATIWRDVPGYDGLYLVSNEGEVYSTKSQCVLKPSICKGYAVVSLYHNKKSKQFKVHRLVATAFIANPLGKETVNHIDENKLNNRVENLDWATICEQNRHGTRTARAAKSKSRAIEQRSLENVVIRIWPSMAEVERALGIRRGNIWACCEGRIGSAGGYVWKRSNTNEFA